MREWERWTGRERKREMIMCDITNVDFITNRINYNDLWLSETEPQTHTFHPVRWMYLYCSIHSHPPHAHTRLAYMHMLQGFREQGQLPITAPIGQFS